MMIKLRTFVSALMLISMCGIQPYAAENPTTASQPIKKIKVGLVFDVGGLGDKSFNDAAYAGLMKAKKELGIEAEYREPGEGAHREAHLRNFAKGDTDLIIGVGFLFSDEIRGMAQDFPKKKFACVDYTVDEQEIPENLAALTFREEEGSFLVGAIAALKSQTGKIGFVGGVESPLIKKFEAGYTQGAKHVRPDVEVKAVYAGVSDSAFKDPQKGKELATSLYDAGCDIIYHASGSTGLGVFKAAEERKKFAIGVDRDQSDEAAPGIILTSMVKNTDQAVFEIIQECARGQFKGGVHSLGLKEGGVGYVYNEKNKELIGEEIHRKVEEIKAKIISGEIKVSKIPSK
ncbi:Nucleoside ABC transporter, periplasmic nucleoside-binding protein [Candidatus Sumerlaea chitinivorans]|uniref:Nucleoside ABC transporter, periplasmic nucleoside-binding protein n=1 Tax=Sumerlaea chitinivorans TaxID=2250252 RepID=A0A2Z4Y2Q6_SUMC1|nr:Nucleoside ABC transporter, periplasmic nucleoside-binding protein [Candidatus Sumerlaea chitinivorans]